MGNRYHYHLVRDVGTDHQSSEQFMRKQDAVDMAALWVQSPLRTGPRTAQVVRSGPKGIEVIASFASPR